MQLDEYLTWKGLTSAAFGKQIGKTRSYVRRLRRKERRPSLATAEDIQRATSGNVRIEDFAGATP